METTFYDINKNEFTIGDFVLVPEPTSLNDSWDYEFEGQVIDSFEEFNYDTGHSDILIKVSDQEDSVFCMRPDQVMVS